jgi:hypothetical protein
MKSIGRVRYEAIAGPGLWDKKDGQPGTVSSEQHHE